MMKNSFSREVHLGLLAIIFVLLLLNFVSNYTIYRARVLEDEKTAQHLNLAAIGISRNITDSQLLTLSNADKGQFSSKYGLSGLVLIPFLPEHDNLVSKRKWFQSIVNELPAGQIPSLASKLLSTEFKSVKRGENSEFFYVYPLPNSSQKKLLILSVNNPFLAMLEDAGNLILIASLVFVFILAGAYVWLYRFILSPFRRLKEEAVGAGRFIEIEGDDVTAVVEGYKSIIEELKDKEQELRALNAKVQLRADSLEQFNNHLLRSLDTGVVTVDDSGVMVSLNRAAQKILLIEHDDLPGKPYSELLRYNNPVVACLRLLSLDRPHPFREYEITLGSGKSLYLGVTCSVILDNTGRKIGNALIITDLTELRDLRLEVERKGRLVALGEMAAGLAHQLRNSIGAILGYCQLLKKRFQKVGEEVDVVTAQEAEIREAEIMIGKFLSFTRPFDFSPMPTPLVKLLKDLSESIRYRPDLGSRRINLNLKITNDLHISLDPLLVKQALTNLIENAINSYGGKSGVVDVNVTCYEGFAKVEIKDYGCGIPAEQIEQIFTPFFSTRASGTGLGLPLAKKIIDLHGGKLSVTSAVGEGTTFSVLLPLTRSGQEALV